MSGSARTTVVAIPTAEITDDASLHAVFKRVMGFPDFYGANADAWVDCMSSVDDADAGMSSVTVAPGELLTRRIDDATDLRARCPEIHDRLLDMLAFVNHRRIAVGEAPVLALLLAGRVA